MAYGKDYDKRIALSKARLNNEMRAIVRRVSHRPRAEIVQIIRERTGAQINSDYLDQILKESS